MNETVTIRKLNENDLNHFFDLRLESLQNSPSSFLSSLDEEKSRGSAFYAPTLNQEKGKDNVIFGAFIENNLIGYVGIYKDTGSKINHKSNIWGLYVKPTYRNRGVAKALLSDVIKFSKNEINCALVKISVEETNTAAKKLYESFNFKIWGTEPLAMQIDGTFYNEHHMMLLI